MPQISSAIDAALCSDWEKAIKINVSILKETPTCVETLNRLGFAYLNLGNIKKAESAFKKVLRIDPFNLIAQKHIKKLKNNAGKVLNINKGSVISPNVFLEEPGITKIVNLININAKSIILNLFCGQKVSMIDKKNRIEIRNEEGIYLGVLPDDLSFRLRKLINLGNDYSLYIKTVDEQQLTIIIREIKRGKKVKDASFVVMLIPKYHTSIRSEILEGLLEDEDEASLEGKEEDEEEE